MFDLVHLTVNSLATANVYGLANITISYFDMILDYLVAIVVSIIIALILRVPLMPSDRYSFAFNGLLLAAIIGICSGLFVKYLFNYIFPSPERGDDINE